MVQKRRSPSGGRLIPNRAIGQDSKHRRKVGHGLDFVENDKPPRGAEDPLRGRSQCLAIDGPLQIVELVGVLAELACQGGLAALTRSEQRDHRRPRQTRPNLGKPGGSWDCDPWHS